MNSKIVTQVDRNVYWSTKYLSPSRLYSYGLQFSEVMKYNPESVLEIGIGNGLLGYMLSGAGVNLTTIDFDKTLEPNIVASVTNIPLQDNTYCIVSCFEVLEHLPFNQVSVALNEIYRVAKQGVVISVPDSGRYVKMAVHFLRMNFEWLAPFLSGLRQRRHQFDGEHYWELNTKGYSLKSFIAMLESTGFAITDTYRAPQTPRHRMFHLEK